MSSVTDWILGLSGAVVYAVVGLLIFAEDALFLGFLLPGETLLLVAGTIAAAHRGVDLAVLVTVVVLTAILGDAVGYWLGRHFGPWVLRTRSAVRHRTQVDRARRLIRDKGAAAVFFGRFFTVFRALVPTLAGISRMPYGRFSVYNIAGATLWGTAYCLLGYGLGSAYSRVENVIGTVATILVGLFALAALVVWLVNRRQSRAEVEAEAEAAARARRAEDPTDAE
ncbi:membrane-associated protein [Kitasatospora sp. MAP12-15]|uniref:DedA family protein n=1 Tax=unclassified Kitasatospora TaxID=2633591 RepID=UPI002476F08B|nr:DedA family protein [Kitasatospora sp. MAP12-44]MDH6113253.1 membrane-associated protein [Kitasatospora sp. MAP12-44]